MFPDLREMLVFFLFCQGLCLREVPQTLYDYNLARGQLIHTRFDDTDLPSRPQVCHNHKLQIVFDFSDSCPLQFKCCVVAAHIKKTKHTMLIALLCVAGVYLI